MWSTWMLLDDGAVDVTEAICDVDPGDPLFDS